MSTISFTLNGTKRTVSDAEDRRLLWVLRDDFGFTGTKFGCGIAACGACAVLVDGKAVKSCNTPMSFVEGKQVTTIEGLAAGDKLQPVQQAFIDHLGFQCGYCTSGMVMGAHALLLRNPKPTREQIVQEMERFLCRCGAHTRIIDAIEAASHATAAGGVR
jgi:aerobic-type carbon monoxide dehydrogenase small subunit (CoxS/CutS family)